MSGLDTTFYVAAGIAVLSTVKAITHFHAVRALLYFIVSLLSASVIFFILGNPFAASLEVITYAGAIMVLFLFIMMTLNLGSRSIQQERAWFSLKDGLGPLILAAILLGELAYTLFWGLPPSPPPSAVVVDATQVGKALFGPYVVGVELSSLLLLTGLIGAYHLGYRSIASAISEKKAGTQ